MQEIVKRGFTVKALVRDDKLPFPKDMPVEIVKGDLLELGSVKLVAGCDVLIHSAAFHIREWRPQWFGVQNKCGGNQSSIDAAAEVGDKKMYPHQFIHAYQQEPSFEILTK